MRKLFAVLAVVLAACHIPTVEEAVRKAEFDLDAQSVVPSDCQAVSSATKVVDDRFEAVRKVTGPIISRMSKRPRHSYYVSDTGSAYGPVLVMWWYVSQRPSSYEATAFGIGGYELEVLDTDIDWARTLGYSVTVVIGLSDETVGWILEQGGLSMRASLSYHELELFIPANYFLGVSHAGSLGWGGCGAVTGGDR